MSSPEIEYKRAARDMAEGLWRRRAGSHIYAVLQGSVPIGCNADDQTLIGALAAFMPPQPRGASIYVHWISDLATNYFSPPDGVAMLYVMRPARLQSMQQALFGNASSYRLTI